MITTRRICASLLLAVLAASAHAQQQYTQYFNVQSGTGFFVNRQDVITNAHVVKGCDEVYIKGAVPETKGKVQVLDEDNDLALIITDSSPQQFAPLRFNIDDLKEGDKVLLMGYPGVEGAEGKFSVATATIKYIPHGLENVPGAEKLKNKFFIDDVLEHGNSGGPVFDTSGNVIGVVVAKTVASFSTQENINLGTIIDLATLKQFLFDHGVYTEWLGSNLRYEDNTIEDNAKSYIVNVQCRIPGTAESIKGVPEIMEIKPPVNTYGR